MVETLLEPIAVGQTRFRMQGLSPDARGVAVGRETLLVLPSIDRLVAFLGAYSEECSLDELLPTMTLERARREGGGHAILVRCAGGDSYALDRLGRMAAAVRGQLYTGGGAVFVRYRERVAPFGYDLAAALSVGADDVLAVDIDFAARYRAVDRLDPVELIQRLSLQPVPLPIGGIAVDPDLCGLADLALVLVAPGLSERVLSYLWAAQVPMAGVHVALEGERRASLLLRLRQPTAAILDVLHGIPGVELHAPVSERAAVELGYRHPIHLASATSCLPGDEMYLFRGRARRVERLEAAPRFIDGRHLVRSDISKQVIEPGDARTLGSSALRVDLTLRTSTTVREPRGALIPWAQSELLRRLVYVIPPTALAAARLTVLPEGLLVLTGSSLGGLAAGVGAAAIIPLGTRICEIAPGVYVPDGYELWPRVRPQLVRELLGLAANEHALFRAPPPLPTKQEGERRPLTSAPVRLRPEHLTPLDAAVIGRMQLHESEALAAESSGLAPAAIVNDRLGRFALWGFGATLDRGRE
ncbi:MAG: hypothetical protein KC636_33890 [Myxococcales bacterium]|nr:hypothetical protein [Myxococcales bacterium]